MRTQEGADRFKMPVGSRITVARTPKGGTRKRATPKPKSTDVDAQHRIYRAVFDMFSADVAELIQVTGMSKEEVLSHLRALKKTRLIAPVGSEMGDWQAWMTYDDIDEEEADRLFDEKVPGRKGRGAKSLLDRIDDITTPGLVG